MTHRFVRWPVLIIIATTLTIATVVAPNWTGGYGFPLSWKNGGCPPPGIVVTAACLLAIGDDWLGFGIDALFFTLTAYALLLVVEKYRRRKLEDSIAR